MKRHLLLGITAIAILVAAPFMAAPASAALAATANFSIVGGDLQIVLTNTSTDDVTAPIQILTGFFFDLAGSPTLTPVSAYLTAGSTVYFPLIDVGDVAPADGNLGGEWGLATNFAALGTTYGYGIGSAGLGIFGAANFNGPNLQGPAGVDGGQYGITSAGDDLTTGNAKVTGGEALVKNSVTFLLSGATDFTVVPDVSNIYFQYGTSLAETPPVPEPGTMLLLGSGLVGLAGWGRKKFRK